MNAASVEFYLGLGLVALGLLFVFVVKAKRHGRQGTIETLPPGIWAQAIRNRSGGAEPKPLRTNH